MSENQKSESGQVTLSLNKQTLVHGILAVNLGLLLVFGWQIVSIKKTLADSPTKVAKVGQVDVKPSAAAPSKAPSAGTVKAPSAEEYIKGNPSAVISLIEYSDFECPFCKRFHPSAQQAVDESDGQVNWLYRHFPLSFHANAQKEAEAAECAGDQGGADKFWEYTDLIFARTSSNGTGFALSALVPLAEEIGLNGATFQSCLDSGEKAAKVQQDLREGQAAGVTGTPGTIVYNNKTGESTLVPGALPYAQLKSAIESVL